MHVKESALAMLLALPGVLLPCGLEAASSESYEFKVLLDEKEIGRQEFLVSRSEGETRVEIDARFDVKFLFFNAYRYRHSNVEIWREGCLRSIESATEDGGEDFFVRGEYEEGVLTVRNREGAASLKGCVRTYAYWEPALISGERLLNSQTGNMDKVEILRLGEQIIPVRDVPMRAERRRIVSEEFSIDLWYADGEKWVALESTASNGGRLRYVLD